MHPASYWRDHHSLCCAGPDTPHSYSTSRLATLLDGEHAVDGDPLSVLEDVSFAAATGHEDLPLIHPCSSSAQSGGSGGARPLSSGSSGTLYAA